MNDEDVKKAKGFVKGLAGVAAGLLGFVEDLEHGNDFVDAALHGVIQGRRKAKELFGGKRKRMKRADEATTHEERMQMAQCGCGSGQLFTACHGIRSDKPFELCSCGCGLPKKQCMGRSAGGGGGSRR